MDNILIKGGTRMTYKYKQGQYVQGSTRGKAIISPTKFKGDTLIQAWVDRRKLAMISTWLDEGGYQTRFLTDLIKHTVDIVVDNIINNSLVREVKYTDEASKILNLKYRTNLNPGGRGLKNLQNNLVLSEIRRNEDNGTRLHDTKQMEEMLDAYNNTIQSNQPTEAHADTDLEYDSDGIYVGVKQEPSKDPVDLDKAVDMMNQKDKALEDF